MYDELKSPVSGLSRNTAYDGPDSVKREPDMLRALSRQQSVVSELEGLCNALEDRLRGVLRPEPKGESQEKPDMTKPPLVQALDDSTDRIHRANMYLSSTLNRLEV